MQGGRPALLVLLGIFCRSSQVAGFIEDASEPMDITRLQPFPSFPFLDDDESDSNNSSDDEIDRIQPFETADIKLHGGYQKFFAQTLADCGANHTDLMEGDYGFISTPRYPRLYPPNQNCIWNLESEPGTVITATFFDMVSQGWLFTSWDYIYVSRTGEWDNFTRYTGDFSSETPFNITSEENKMLIYFHSSFLFNFRGFKLQYLVHRPNAARSTKPVGEPNCGRPSEKYLHNKTRVVGGSETAMHQYPWMAFLVIDGRSVCGGSIITRKHIMTAAHCTDGAKEIVVALAAHNVKAKEPGRIKINTTKWHQHPYYNPITIHSDIAIVELPVELDFNDEIRPICLPSRHYSPDFHFGESFPLSGWGRTADSSSISPYLKHVNLTVLPNQVCAGRFGKLVTGNLICAGEVKGESACQGDSGGPLHAVLCDGTFVQQGIVSFGGKSCQKGYPNGFTRVSAFIDFIHNVTKINF